MARNNAHYLFSALLKLCKALWQLLLWGLYASAIIIKTTADFCGKLLEKLMK